jgi:deazaflavin-dependent oxidoreductase (nitroreductase family)
VRDGARIAIGWGTEERERSRPFPGDRLLDRPDAVYFRGVTIRAPAAVIFRWLCQLRVAAYSYDWISHPSRRSPRRLVPGLEELAAGQRVMGSFDLVDFEHPRHLTLRLRPDASEARFLRDLAVSYVVEARGSNACRLLVKLTLRHRPGAVGWVTRLVAPWLDLLMMRRQLLNFRALAEQTAVGSGEPSRATRPRRLGRFDLLARLMDLVDFPALHAGWYRLLGGRLAGGNTLLLTSIGRRTGLPRTTPLLFVREGGDYVIIASNGGDDPYPGWWYNLRANPEVEIQVGRRRIACRAIETDETERKRLAAKLDGVYGGYETYRQKTRRDLTIFRLQPRLDPGLEPGP